MSEFETTARLLNDRLDLLTGRVRQIETDLRQPLDADSEEQATDLEGHETLEAMEQAAVAEIAQIRQALARIADGSYGTCSKCGGPIAPQRLKALPTATECIVCAKQ